MAGAGPDRAGDVAAYALRLGDDALVLAQRLSVWVASAPDLEEDLAIANIALDLLGQARSLLSYAGELEGAGRDEDALALERDERDFTNVLLVEQPNGDFGTTMARQLLFSAYQLELYRDLTRSTDETLAGVAAKAEKEVAYHRDHAARWVVRLGDGTEESHVRMQAGVDQVWPYAEELWDVDDLQGRLQGCGVAPGLDGLRPACEAFVAATLAEATLSRPETTWRPSGGRGGRHTEPFGYMLAEMQHLHRSHQGARW
ncbi:MAG: 1,2-phenylacetyl-CoA epoxidase subunit PaaC [Acidimicrobiales bacterium]